MDSNSNPVSCTIYDGANNLLFKVSYGYRKSDGQLVEERMFDARNKRVDPNSGMKADRILEFNADHPIFAKLQIAVAQDEKKAEDLVKILYTQALLMADLPVENAGEYTDLVCSLIG